mmetsp:Transcript_18260/g.38354  ORF Transcript_18260/g.38354 Transcript_18260/m.38354 type:complete len:94 (+) Transcript_18260:463-744(+)
MDGKGDGFMLREVDGERDGVLLEEDDGAVVGIGDGMLDGSKLNEGLEDCCTTIVTTAGSDDREAPRAIDSNTTRAKTAARRILALLCLHIGIG